MEKGKKERQTGHLATDIFLEHRSVLKAFLMNRLANTADVEDVLQDVYLRISKSAEELDIRNMRAFIFKTAHNLAVDLHRRKKVRRAEPLHDAMIFEVPSPEPSPEIRAISADWYRRLTHVIDKMPARRQQIFVLHKIRQLSYREIADHLDLPVKRIEKHMSKALKDCRTQLKDLLEDIKN